MRRRRPRPSYFNRAAVRRLVGWRAVAVLVSVLTWRVAHGEPRVFSAKAPPPSTLVEIAVP